MESHLRLQQSSSLTITPQLQQAIQLLQLSYQDLEAFLQSHLEQNPFLTTGTEEDEGDSENLFSNESALLATVGDSAGGSSPRTSDLSDLPELLVPAAPLTLREHLIQQIGSHFTTPQERLIGAYLVQFIQPTGYFEGNIRDIAQQLGVMPSDVTRVLGDMQRFDPSGVCAPDLRSCLAVQLEDRGLLSPSYTVLLDHLELAAQGDIAGLSRKCQIPSESVRQMLQEIRTLTPKPGLAFQTETHPLLIPEVLVQWDVAQKDWMIFLNPETTPKVLLNKAYYTHVRSQISEKSDRTYVASQVAHANWLIKALHQRSMTLLRVTTEIVRQQHDFFAHGIHALKPLILKDVSQTLSLHESTVSRVTNQKYVATPRGTFELRYFFSSGLDNATGDTISSESVRHRIQALIAKEPPQKPLSDGALAILLQKEGIDIARRTVAKYRELLNIAPAFQRQRWKKMGIKT